ncbi:MAG: FAD-linked oxidase [Nitrospirales bacterium]|nr:MAG: FAD-linked oxidase [Nitrospirales bacterium]
MRDNHQSWGSYPKAYPQHVHPIRWRHEALPQTERTTSVLPYGNGRSYGDSCQNNGATLLTTHSLRRFISFDHDTGVLRCEGGVLLADILDNFVPQGWFLPVTPGTKHVSIGGAIANDVHGKNHHKAGTFGCHVRTVELLRSTGERITCSPHHHSELFRATIGGLGLTGLIVWADIQLKPITSPLIDKERIRFSGLDEFFDLSNQSNTSFEYTVGWIDCLANQQHTGRGVFIRGNHCADNAQSLTHIPRRTTLTVPFHLPSAVLHSGVIKIFNRVYYHLQPRQLTQARIPYEKFFYPLDTILHWNRLYGTRGFLQYQCVIPSRYEREGIRDLLSVIQQSQQGSFLAVIKTFGAIQSPGLLSFPKPGTTLALDFPFFGEQTLTLLTKLDSLVRETGGAVYPAKDAHMSSEDFQAYFPAWHKIEQLRDPKFSSSFWRRVTRLNTTPQHSTKSESYSLATEKEQAFAHHSLFNNMNQA